MRILGILLVLFLACDLAAADNVNRSGTYKVGDTVEVWLNVNGPLQWVQCTVLQINGEDVEVHYGGGRYNKKWVKLADLRNEAKEKAASQASANVNAFWAEVDPKYREAMNAWAPTLRAEIKTGFGAPTTIERFTKDLAALAELDALCKSKYAGIKDTETVWKDDIRKLPGTWCEVAAKRMQLGKVIAGQRTKEIMDAELALVDKLLEPEVKSVHVVAGSWYKDLYAGVDYDKVKGLVWTSKHVDLLTNGGKGTVAAIKTQLSGWTAALGAGDDPAIATFLSAYAKKLEGVKPAVDAALPPPVFVAKQHDPTMEAAAKAGIDGKILKSAVMTAGWIVTVDARNLPIERVKIGTIFYEKGPYCIYRSYSFKQSATNGKFTTPGKVHDSADWMMRCK